MESVSLQTQLSTLGDHLQQFSFFIERESRLNPLKPSQSADFHDRQKFLSHSNLSENRDSFWRSFCDVDSANLYRNISRQLDQLPLDGRRDPLLLTLIHLTELFDLATALSGFQQNDASLRVSEHKSAEHPLEPNASLLHSAEHVDDPSNASSGSMQFFEIQLLESDNEMDQESFENQLNNLCCVDELPTFCTNIPKIPQPLPSPPHDTQNAQMSPVKTSNVDQTNPPSPEPASPFIINQQQPNRYPGTILQEVLETIFGSTLPIVIVDSALFLTTEWLVQCNTNPSASVQYPSFIPPLISTLIFLSKGYDRTVRMFVEDSFVLDLLRILLALFSSPPTPSLTSGASEHLPSVSQLIFLFTLCFAQTDHPTVSDIPIFSKEIYLYWPQDSETVTPYFSPVPASQEQKLKATRLRLALERHFSTLSVSFSQTQSTPQQKQNIARSTFPLFLALSILSETLSAEVVELFQVLILPHLSTFSSMFAFIHSSFTPIAQNIPSITFPVLLALSHIHHSSKASIWHTCCVYHILPVIHSLFVSPANSVDPTHFNNFWTELIEAINHFISFIEQSLSIRVTSVLNPSESLVVFESGMRLSILLLVLQHLILFRGNKATVLSNLLHLDTFWQDFLCQTCLLLTSLQMYFRVEEAMNSVEVSTPSDDEGRGEGSVQSTNLDWDSVVTTNSVLSNPGDTAVRCVFGSILLTVFHFFDLQVEHCNELVQPTLSNLFAFLPHHIPLLTPTLSQSLRTFSVGERTHHILHTPSTRMPDEEDENRSELLFFPFDLAVSMSSVDIMHVFIYKVHQLSAETCLINSVVPFLLSNIDTTLAQPRPLRFSSLLTRHLNFNFLFERATVMILQQLHQHGLRAEWVMWMRNAGMVRPIDELVLGYFALAHHLIRAASSVVLVDCFDWIVVIAEVVEDVVAGKGVSGEELEQVFRAKFPSHQAIHLFPITPVSRGKQHPFQSSSLVTFLSLFANTFQKGVKKPLSLFTNDVLRAIATILKMLARHFRNPQLGLRSAAMFLTTPLATVLKSENEEERHQLSKALVETGVLDACVELIEAAGSVLTSTFDTRHRPMNMYFYIMPLVDIVDECRWLSEQDEAVKGVVQRNDENVGRWKGQKNVEGAVIVGQRTFLFERAQCLL
ncbi:hypothetical protein BLNAU_11792 [Blattamonas nauphoetae]|uniref:Uncharacterized protein n=1 Tax=Blattamonas nauphoetae TaxID=2049346 RepID=A0ABQ9XNK4_9EUKA|nr:hypothetical protein BLNAU_11792 [Blattamonas nauphoetae]